MLVRSLNLVRQLASEHVRVENLKKYQFRKLQQLIYESYAHTPAYRCLMQRARVRPENIKSLSDLERLPIVAKRDLSEFSEAERSHKLRIDRYKTVRLATSGSSGVPFEFIVDSDYNAWRKAQYLRPYVTNGRRPWHSVLRLTAYPRTGTSGGSFLNPFREKQIYCTAPTTTQLSELLAMRPSILQGYPSALRCLAFDLIESEITTPYVKSVFTDSELLTPDSRAIIERAFNAPVIDVFGSYETDNIAYQCSSTSHYHATIDSVIMEVVRQGQAVANGSGELVVTVLNNLTMPFIRYNLADCIDSVAEPCGCGRTFPLIRIVAGRNDDLVIDKYGSRKSPLSFLWRLDAFSDLIREYQIAQLEIDKFDMRIVPARHLTDEDMRRIQNIILVDYPQADVRISTKAVLQRSQAAKLKAFVCEVSRKKAAVDCGN